jgi:AcrR family transcriptional regulator
VATKTRSRTAKRLPRGAQVERNREALLAAARRVFLKRGFHGATLDAIAEEAGFSKGVVYSQFDSKGDLFLALLDARIEERAAENERAQRAARTPRAGIEAVIALGERRSRETDWNHLLVEFRAAAARDPALRERYAKAHARTVEGIATLLARTFAEQGVEPTWPPHVLAAFVLAASTGKHLENSTAPGAIPAPAFAWLIARACGLEGDT